MIYDEIFLYFFFFFQHLRDAILVFVRLLDEWLPKEGISKTFLSPNL